MKNIYIPIFVLLSFCVMAQLPTPVFHAPLNGNINDISPNPLPNGTIVGGGAFTSTGVCSTLGSSFLIGSNATSAIEFNHATKLNLTSEVTMAAWIYLNSLSNASNSTDNESEIISKGSYNLGVRSNGSTTSLGLDFEAGGNARNSTITSIIIGQWTHVAVTFKVSDGLVRYYINGVLAASYNSNSIIGINTEKILIGGYSPDDTYQFPGKMQDVRIYNTKLTDAQIAQIFNSFYVNGPILTTACGTSSAVMSVQTLTGSSHSFQWYQDGALLPGETSNTLTINPASTAAGAVFSVVGISSCGTYTTTGASLLVPTVSGVLVSSSVTSICPNFATTLTCSALGSNLSYKWFKNNALITAGLDGGIYKDFNTATLSISGFPASLGGSNVDFTCQVYNSCLTVTSNMLTISVVGLPSISGFVGNAPACTSTATTIVGNAINATFYQWYRDSNALNNTSDGGIYGDSFSTTGLNISALPFANTTSVVGYNLSVTGTCGTFSRIANVTILGNTSVSGAVAATNYCVGNTKTIAINTLGGANLTYTWGMYDALQTTFTALTNNALVANVGTVNGINSRNITFSGLQANITNVFICTITGSCGSVVASAAGFNYLQNVATTSLAGITVCPNDSPTFSTTATGAGPITYTWYENTGGGFSLMTGEIADNITKTTVNPSQNGDRYYVVVTGFCNTVTTPNATLNVNTNSSATILTATTICAGSMGSLVLTVTSVNPTYKWYKNNVAINVSTDVGTYSNSFSTSGLSFTNTPSSIAGAAYKCTIQDECGVMITTSSAIVSVANLPFITVQPNSIFTTCVGLSSSIQALATGTGINYRWQYFNTVGNIWANLTTTLGSFTGTNTLKLNVFNFNNTMNGLNFRVSVSGFCAANTVSNVSTLQVNFGPQVQIFGWKSKYCENDGQDTLKAFSDLSLPNSSITGTFSMLSGSATLNALGFNSATFNPNTSTGNGNISIKYQSALNAVGCQYTTTLTAPLYTVSGFDLDWTSPSAGNNSYSVDSPVAVPLVLSAAAGEVGTSIFSATFAGMNQSGITGSQFYPSNINPKPTASVNNNEKKVNLIGKFTSNATGCSASISKEVNVFFPQNFYKFIPESPLVDKSSFCATDFTARLVSMTGATLDNPNRCLKSQKIQLLNITNNTVPGLNHAFGVLDGSTNVVRYDLSSYTFTGGSLLAGNYFLEYVLDFNALNLSTTFCLIQRTETETRRQEIKIFSIPTFPRIRDYTRCEASASLSDLIVATADNENIEWYTTTSTSSIISSITGLASVSLAQLGITGTGFATYKRYARQYQNGCPGRLKDIDIEIKKTPSKPNFITTLPLTGGCANNAFTRFTITVASSTLNASASIIAAALGGATYLNYLQLNTSNTVTGGIIYDANYQSNVPTIGTYTGISNLNGCLSERGYHEITINETPPNATLSGANNRCMDYDGIFRASPIEVKVNSTMPISFSGTYDLTGAGGFLDLDFTITTFDGLGTKATINTSLNKTQTGKTSLKVYATNTITGCNTRNAALFESSNLQDYTVYAKPSPPFVNANEPFCNSANYGTVSVIGNGFSQVNWYSNLSATTLLGTGNVLNLATCLGCLPANRHSKAADIDTLYYAAQTQNGCQSSLVGVSFKMFAPFQPMPIFKTFSGSAFGIELTRSDQLCTQQDFGSVKVRNRNAAPAPAFGAFRSFNIFAGSNYYYQMFGAEELPLSLLGPLPAGSQIPFLAQEVYFTTLGKICSSSTTLTSGIAYVNQTPSPPILRDTAYCVPGIVGNLRALSTIAGSVVPTFTWYSSSNIILAQSSTTGSNSTVTGSTLSGKFQSIFATTLSGISQNSSTSGVYLFYVSQKIKGCESKPSLAATTMYVYATPQAPKFRIPKNEICNGEAIPLLEINGTSASNSRIDWFSAKNVASIVGSNITQYAPNIANTAAWTGTSTSAITTIFYATDLKYNITTTSLRFEGCRSAFGEDTIIVQALPPAPITNNLIKLCVENPKTTTFSNLSATGVNGVGASFAWLDFANTETNSPTKDINNINTAIPNSYAYKVFDEFNNCESLPALVTVTVYALPNITINGLSTNYCEYDTPITFSGFSNASLLASNYSIEATLFPFTVPSAMLQTFVGLNRNAVFNPSTKDVNSSQSYTISYQIKDANNCSNESNKTVNVYAKTISNFSFKDNDTQIADSVCSSDAKITMIGQNGGSFASTRIGVVGNEFFPADVVSNSPQIDTVSIKYTYTDANGCFNRTQKLITVFPSPKAQFKLSSHCVGNVSIVGTSTLVPKNGVSIAKYAWLIDNQSQAKSKDTVMNFAAGLHNFYYKVTESAFGCTSELDIDSIVDAYPIVAFNWKNICAGDSTQFIDNSYIPIGGGTLDTLVWQIGTNTRKGFNTFGKSIKIFSPNAQAQTVTLIAQTNEKCATTVTSNVNILPTVATYPYDQAFENAQGLWFAEGKSSTWEWGNNTQLGGNYWATSLQGNHAANERSFLNTPCFDMDMLDRPMIRLDVNYKTNSAIDGSVLQFSTDGGTVWQPLNDFRTGINWYNSRNIVNDPGDQNSYLTAILNNPTSAATIGTYARQMGWNGNSQGWKIARNTLDEVKRQTNGRNQKVRFRIAFAAAGATQADGFAIDNVWIGQRTKSVLLENFVNTQSAASNIAQSNTLDNFILNNKDDVVGINYHTSFPANDIFNAANPSDPSTRVLFYGIENVPRSALDGEIVAGNSSTIGLNTVKDKSLINPLFEIFANKTNINNNFNVTVQYKATENIPENTELIAQVVIIEKTIANIGGLSKKYYNVIKKILPSAAGTSFFGAWTKGDYRELNLNWNYASNTDIYNKDSLGVVVFIQNRNTKEVLQTAYYGPSQSTLVLPLGVFDAQKEKIHAITIYPNPAENNLSIIYPKLTQNTAWQMYDNVGKLVKNGILYAELQIENLDVSTLAEGMYQLKVGSTVKKIVITKK